MLSKSEEINETSSEDTSFITLDFETEDESSEDDGHFLTPPNSPIIDNLLPELTEDEISEDEREDDEGFVSSKDEEEDSKWDPPGLPLLLSDSEDEEDKPGPPGPGNRALNTIFARPTPVDKGLEPATPGA